MTKLDAKPRPPTPQAPCFLAKTGGLRKYSVSTW